MRGLREFRENEGIEGVEEMRGLSGLAGAGSTGVPSGRLCRISHTQSLLAPPTTIHDHHITGVTVHSCTPRECV